MVLLTHTNLFSFVTVAFAVVAAGSSCCSSSSKWSHTVYPAHKELVSATAFVHMLEYVAMWLLLHLVLFFQLVHATDFGVRDEQ